MLRPNIVNLWKHHSPFGPWPAHREPSSSPLRPASLWVHLVWKTRMAPRSECVWIPQTWAPSVTFVVTDEVLPQGWEEIDHCCRWGSRLDSQSRCTLRLIPFSQLGFSGNDDTAYPSGWSDRRLTWPRGHTRSLGSQRPQTFGHTG